MKKIIYILILVVLSSCINQNKKKSEKLTEELLITKMFKAKSEDLSREIKDSLLEVKQIIFRFEDEEEIEEETIHLSIDSSKNAIRVESSGNMNSSFVDIEYRAVTISNCQKLIYSKTIGTSAFTNQDEFEIYNFDSKSNRLILDTISTNFFNIKDIDLFQKNTPDSIIEYYQYNADFHFSIYYTNNGIAEYVMSMRTLDEKNGKWLIGEIVTFDIEDNKFTKSKPHKRE